jgi:hypothetical protein
MVKANTALQINQIDYLYKYIYFIYDPHTTGIYHCIG